MIRTVRDLIFWTLILVCCMAALMMDRWVDTTDTQWIELPAPGEVVNICTKDGDITMATYQNGKWLEVDSDWEIRNVQYWAYREK